jgi:hypothetical protein
MEISATGLGEDEEEEGSNVWTEHLTEELPALMERMIVAIFKGSLDCSCSIDQFCQGYKISSRVYFE